MARQPASATAPGRSLDKKLSVKGLGWDKATILKTVLGDQNAEHFLARFVGVATAPRPYKVKEGDRAGEIAYGLIGQFEGTSADGVVMRSAVCYLPEYATEMVLGALASAGDDSVSVRIAFDIYASYDEKAATSYVFSVRDLLMQSATGVDEVNAMITALPMPPKQLALEGGK